jgi:hypothetical protein
MTRLAGSRLFAALVLLVAVYFGAFVYRTREEFFAAALDCLAVRGWRPVEARR